MKAKIWGALLAGAVLCLIQGCSTTEVLRNVSYTDTGVNEPDAFPILRAAGYAVISSQPGRTRSEKELQAMRASKLDAYRELTEQVSGIYIKSGNSMYNARTGSDHITAEVEGFVHGARVVRQYPLDNTYVTELELDSKVLYDMYQMRGAY